MYRPHRDYRFEYVTDAINHIEQLQCGSCVFREEGEYPMCLPISGNIILEEPVEEINDLGRAGLVCTKYRLGEPTPQQVDGQKELF
jgi:hypothetical protein